MPNDYDNRTLEELANSDAKPGSIAHTRITHQFSKRTTEAQIRTADQQTRAVKWMMLSVIVLAATSLVDLGLTHWPLLMELWQEITAAD